MQEEVESKMVALSMQTTKLTAKELKAAIEKFLNAKKNKNIKKVSVTPQGKQTLKQLAGQKEGLSNIEITDGNIKSFDRVARKYHVDYALKKDKTQTPPRYIVFFKAKDMSAIDSAFKEYTNNVLNKKPKKSLYAEIAKAMKKIIEKPTKTRNKELDR